jgi:hypothetical protein
MQALNFLPAAVRYTSLLNQVIVDCWWTSIPHYLLDRPSCWDSPWYYDARQSLCCDRESHPHFKKMYYFRLRESVMKMCAKSFIWMLNYIVHHMAWEPMHKQVESLCIDASNICLCSTDDHCGVLSVFTFETSTSSVIKIELPSIWINWRDNLKGLTHCPRLYRHMNELRTVIAPLQAVGKLTLKALS